jgi:hypothetical protein
MRAVRDAGRLLRGAVLVLIALGISCAPSVPAIDAPEWLERVIADIEREPVTNPPTMIARYQYRGQTVYYRPPYCCDITSTLYDSTGTFICAPDGGLTGDGDGRCADFYEARRDESIIWRDTRRYP